MLDKIISYIQIGHITNSKKFFYHQFECVAKVRRGNIVTK